MAGPTAPGSTRIKGTKISLVLGPQGADYWMDATTARLENEESESETVTFYDAAHAGARQWFFTVEGIQSTEPSSLWRFLWDNTGKEVSFTYAPHGNDDPSPNKPHFTGTCEVGPKPAIGGEAGENVNFTFEHRLDLTDGPHMKTTSQTNEVQTLTRSGNPTGGSFTLSYDGDTTGSVKYNASANDVRAALVALSTIPSGAVAVSGGPLGGNPVTVEFKQELGGQDVPLMTVDASNLTGGNTPTVTVTETTKGG